MPRGRRPGAGRSRRAQAGGALDDQAGEHVVAVGVAPPPRAWRRARRPELGDRCRGVPSVAEASRGPPASSSSPLVCCNTSPHGDVVDPAPRRRARLGHVGAHRRVEAHLSGVDQLHDRQRGERLARRAEHERSVRGCRRLPPSALPTPRASNSTLGRPPPRPHQRHRTRRAASRRRARPPRSRQLPAARRRPTSRVAAAAPAPALTISASAASTARPDRRFMTVCLGQDRGHQVVELGGLLPQGPVPGGVEGDRASWSAPGAGRTTPGPAAAGRVPRGALGQVDRHVQAGGLGAEVDVLELRVQHREHVDDAPRMCTCSSRVYSSTKMFSLICPAPSLLALWS